MSQEDKNSEISGLESSNNSSECEDNNDSSQDLKSDELDQAIKSLGNNSSSKGTPSRERFHKRDEQEEEGDGYRDPRREEMWERQRYRQSREDVQVQMLRKEEEERQRMKDIMIKMCSYLEDRYYEEMKKIIYEKEQTIHYDINLDLLEFLYHFSFEGSKFHDYPKEFLKFLKKCFTAVQSKLILQIEGSVKPFLTVKKHIDIRLNNIPPLTEITLETIRNLRQCHVNKYIVIYGTIIRTSNMKNRETKKDFACKNCGKIYTANSDIYEFNRFLLPPICGGEVEKRPNPFFNMIQTMRNKKFGNKAPFFNQLQVGACNQRFFLPVHGTAQYKDYQEIKIQEVYKTLKPGVIPRSMIVILEDNLVEVGKPGDDVMISGILIQRWKSPFNRLDRPEIELAVLANNVVVLNKREFNIKQEINRQACSDFKKYWKVHDKNVIEGKNQIIESICPHIFERYPEKLGILLSIVGGVPKQSGTDPRIRGQIHMLMIGEPGTGKSQLLSFAQKISMRSVITTGIGTTSAGLTVAAFKDGNEWILEAGALVLADCGVCCIDEFALIKNEDRGSVHEAMEQQTISIAKGGIVCKINSRATIIAATNPSKTNKWNSKYDNNQNTGIATSLLSRFDFVFIMLDAQSTEQDLAQANFKLAMSRNDEDDEEEKRFWTVDRLTKYIVFIQRYIEPEITEEAEMIFECYYQFIRGKSSIPKDRKTVRMLESLVRISQAHARLMFRKDVIIYDAICAIVLIEHCLNTEIFDELYPVIMSRQMYEKAKFDILTKLGLDPQYFDEEFDHYQPEQIRKQYNFSTDTMIGIETYGQTDQTHVNTHAATAKVKAEQSQGNSQEGGGSQDELIKQEFEYDDDEGAVPVMPDYGYEDDEGEGEEEEMMMMQAVELESQQSEEQEKVKRSQEMKNENFVLDQTLSSEEEEEGIKDEVVNN